MIILTHYMRFVGWMLGCFNVRDTLRDGGVAGEQYESPEPQTPKTERGNKAITNGVYFPQRCIQVKDIFRQPIPQDA